MPAIEISPKLKAVMVATLFARRQAASSPPRAMVLLKVVTNAVDSAPSANKSRSRLGMRNATVKASSARPPPNRAANINSRARPSTRLHITAKPMMPAALVFRRSGARIRRDGRRGNRRGIVVLVRLGHDVKFTASEGCARLTRANTPRCPHRGAC